MRPPGRALRPGGPAPRCQRPRPAAAWPASGPVGGGRARRARSASRRGWPWAGPSRPRRPPTFASRPSGRPRGAAASRGARSSTRKPVHRLSPCGTGTGRRRAPLGRQDRLLPRRRRRREPLGEPQERDAPQEDVRGARRGEVRLHRVGRGVPRPPMPALVDWVQAPGGRDGRFQEKDGGGKRFPGGIVSEILTHFSSGQVRGHHGERRLRPRLVHL